MSEICVLDAVLEDVLSPWSIERADEAVAEVFGSMLGMAVTVLDGGSVHNAGTDDRTAVVGLSGAMRGSCELRMSSLAAGMISSAMLGGTPEDKDEDSLDDAVGELCNMLAGGWKDRLPMLAEKCLLAPPTVISGRNYKLHWTSPTAKMSRCYGFDGQVLMLTIHRVEAA